LEDGEIIEALESSLAPEFVPEPCSKGKMPFNRLASKVKSVLKIWDQQPGAKQVRRIKTQEEERLRNIMQHYIKEHIPVRVFCADFLKIRPISNKIISDALESPLGIELIPQPRSKGKEPYERLAAKVMSVLNDESYEPKIKLEPIQEPSSSGQNPLQKLAMNVEKALVNQRKPTHQKDFEGFSGEVDSLVDYIKGEMNGISSNRKRHLSDSINEGSPKKRWTAAEKRTRREQLKESLSNPNSSSSNVIQQSTISPPKNGTANNGIPKDFYAPITHTFNARQARLDQLIAFNPNDVEKSDSDQSGSEEETEDFNRNFSSQMIAYRQERENENLRNRTFRPPGQQRSNSKPRRKRDLFKNYRRYFGGMPPTI